MHHAVGEVAVDEELAGREVHDLVGGHAAVRAPDPEIFRTLLPRQSREELRVALADALGPRTVVVEEV